jgi:RND family efflux transporter MFP subunit
VKDLRLVLQILLPLIVLGGGTALAFWIASKAPKPDVETPQTHGPLVRTIVAEATDVRLDVNTQGTVEAWRSIQLSSQVGGRIVATHDALRPGGFVAAGDVLVEIDPVDFELAVVQQEAAVANAELRVMQERAEADAAVRAWKELEGQREADPLVVRTPQIVDAEKALAGARAALDRAKLDLQRTKLTAPFACVVRSANAEIGQTVQSGQVLAELIDTAAVEVRLPIPTTDAAFVDLPLPGAGAVDGPAATLTVEFAGKRHEWPARVMRTEGEIDRRTRQLTVVARVDEPFAAGAGRPPLLVGTFVQACIHGRQLSGVVAVPRSALRPDDEVWVVQRSGAPADDPHAGNDTGGTDGTDGGGTDGADSAGEGASKDAGSNGHEWQLARRPVEVLRTESARVLLRSGVTAGERVCVTHLEAVTDSMSVRVQVPDEKPPAGANGTR